MRISFFEVLAIATCLATGYMTRADLTPELGDEIELVEIDKDEYVEIPMEQLQQII